jgi:hypothetical protein
MNGANLRTHPCERSRSGRRHEPPRAPCCRRLGDRLLLSRTWSRQQRNSARSYPVKVRFGLITSDPIDLLHYSRLGEKAITA